MLRSLLALTLAAQLAGTAALAAPSGDPGAPDPVAECDRLAASPRDPQRVGDGVKGEDLRAGPAVAACRAAVVADPATPRLAYQLGRALQRSGQYAEASQWYRRAADAGSAVARTDLGLMYHSGDGVPQDDAQAAALYRAAMPDDPWSFACLGYLLQQGLGVPQDQAEALRLYRLGSAAGDPWADIKIGETYDYGLGVPADPVEAMRWYRRAADAGEAMAFYDLANLYADGAGVPVDTVEAERLWQVAIDRGGLWQAKNALAFSWADAGRNLEAALRLAEEALADQPEDGDVHDTHAWVLFRLGRVEEAAAELEHGLAQNPYDPALVHAHLGEVYAARDEPDKARAEWEAALKADPDPELAASVRKKLGGDGQ